jgi:hypothetical protein
MIKAKEEQVGASLDNTVRRPIVFHYFLSLDEQMDLK